PGYRADAPATPRGQARGPLRPRRPVTGMDATAWDERYRSAELVWGVRPNRWVERELADLPPGRALDLACGEGRNALWLAARGWQVTAVDFSAVALDKARALESQQSSPPAAWMRARPTGC